MKLSIVIPAYNESERIKNTFSRLDNFFSKRDYEMEYIFVEDGSSDNTLALLKELEKKRSDVKIIINQRNMGKGYSIKRGALEASGDYVLFIDADMSTSLKAFDKFKPFLDEYDIIIGSRWCEDSDIRILQPWPRRFMGNVFYLIVNAFFLKEITDANCGFKCYKRDVTKDIFSKQLLHGWGFDVELLYIAQKLRYRIKEVPVTWAHGRDSKVNLLVVPFHTLIELARIKINDWKKRYD